MHLEITDVCSSHSGGSQTACFWQSLARLSSRELLKFSVWCYVLHILLVYFSFNRLSFIHSLLFIILIYCTQCFPTFYVHLSHVKYVPGDKAPRVKKRNKEKDPLGPLRITDLYPPMEGKSEQICWLLLTLICFNTWLITRVSSHISETSTRCFPRFLIFPAISDLGSINSYISMRALFVQSDNKIYIFICSI